MHVQRCRSNCLGGAISVPCLQACSDEAHSTLPLIQQCRLHSNTPAACTHTDLPTRTQSAHTATTTRKHGCPPRAHALSHCQGCRKSRFQSQQQRMPAASTAEIITQMTEQSGARARHRALALLSTQVVLVCRVLATDVSLSFAASGKCVRASCAFDACRVRRSDRKQTSNTARLARQDVSTL